MAEAKQNTRLLIIAYLFPPVGGIAVQRPLSLAQYLPANGFDVHVLAPKNPSAPAFDEGLLGRIPPSVRVHRAWTPEVPYRWRQKVWGLVSRSGGRRAPAAATGAAAAAAGAATVAPPAGRGLKETLRRWFSPDPQVVWCPFARGAARRIIRQERIDAVLITAPPFSTLQLGPELKREFPHLHLISDFRDEWLDWFLSAFSFHDSETIRQQARTIERRVVESSSLVVSVTEPIVEKLRARYADQPGEKFMYIPNGYDPGLFSSFAPRRHAGDKVVVTYVGTVYRDTSARYYLDALDLLEPELRDRFETHFVGRVDPSEMPVMEGRKSKVVVHGFVSQKQALQRMEETDLLLLTMTDPLCHTGKIFEYLAAGKPTLAFTPAGGEVARMLQRTGGGWQLEPRDPAGAAAELRRIGQLVLKGEALPAPDLGVVGEYDRRRLAGVYARGIQACTAGGVPVASAG